MHPLEIRRNHRFLRGDSFLRVYASLPRFFPTKSKHLRQQFDRRVVRMRQQFPEPLSLDRLQFLQKSAHFRIAQLANLLPSFHASTFPYTVGLPIISKILSSWCDLLSNSPRNFFASARVTCSLSG